VQGGDAGAAAQYHFDKADVVVALDADFLACGPSSVRYSKDFASRRRIDTPQDNLNRLYAVEPAHTVTGSNAEHRLALRARDVHAFTAALAAAVGVTAGGGAATGELPDDVRSRFIPAVAADLQAHRGRCVVVPGDYQPAAVHVLARTINQALGNVGTTVTYTAPMTATPADGVQSISELVADMAADKVKVLLIIGTNPVFTAPSDLNFLAALQKVTARFHLGLYLDETGEQCHWHGPEAHYLETWGDVRAFDGTVSLIQPLIAPLYGGRSAIEIIATANGAGGSAMDLVKGYWTKALGGQTKATWAITDAQGQAFADADTMWKHGLHDGFLRGTATASPAPAAGAPPAAFTPSSTQGMEIVFRPDPYLLDGRNANNGWLQELPRPISKMTWDATAHISPRTAERLGLLLERSGNQDVSLIEIKYAGRTVRIPAWVMPGICDDSIIVHFGFGRRRAGRVGTGVSFDMFPLRTSKAPWFDGGATVTKTTERYQLCSTQNHFSMEGRGLVRAVDIEEYRRNPKAVAEAGPEVPDRNMTLYPNYEYKSHKWGMAIDLNACTGCSACIIACVAENNIPVVGKTQVYRNREMHWLRVDTYYDGAPEAPAGSYHQPIPCQQCENAPCEQVCPVAATVHSDEGLNDMVYNRCVGTRYCSNNCPYKVRRFNFLLYQDFVTPELMAQRNPDVTIRSRGVMEKCTYCVQRIDHARIDAKVEGRSIRDGDIKTACQQVCPSDAIVFGDMNDPASQVNKLKAQQRNYGILEDLNTRPRTSYLAVVRNPNPKLA
jgi:molybdopterin-containing oxidoreductase family iron-sulfur binding subunit